MTNQLIKYEAACRALAECKSVDEAKTWADKAAAMQAYGRMAKDKTMEVDAAEIRIRAERRLGQMLAEQKAQGGLSQAATLKRGPVVVSNDHGKAAPKLADAGISKDLSSRSQKLAAVSAEEFEAALAEKREIQEREGARVTAKLEAAGAKALAKRTPGSIPDAVFAAPDYAPSAEEMADSEQGLLDELTTLRRVAEADDHLAEALAMIKQRDALVAGLQSRIDGLLAENSELVRSVKYWRRQAEKAATA